MKKTFEKKVKILLVFAMILAEFINPISVFASKEDTTPSKGDIYNPQTDLVGNSAIINANSYGSGTYSAGDVEVQKIVSKTSTEGMYEVEFKIRGNNTTVGVTVERPVYVVVVMDASNSMKNTGEKKWNNAVKGAIDFSTLLKTTIPGAQMALVKFAGKTTNTNWNDAEKVRGFSTEAFTTGLIGSTGVNGGATNLGEGLRYAYKILNGEMGEVVPDNAQKYIVVLCDGAPTLFTKENGDSDTTEESNYATRYDTKAHEYATTWADKIKNKNDLNATIVSIGYELDTLSTSKDRRMAPIVLKGISSGDKYYVSGDIDNIITNFSSTSSLIETTYLPGTNVKITDNLGSNFKLSSGSNILTIPKITKNWTPVGKFYITLDKENANKWNPTNNGFEVKYTDYQGKEKKINCNINPEVYWEQKYIVNYYHDEIKSDNLIESNERYAPNGTIININNVEKDKYLNKLEGYEFNSITPNSITVKGNKVEVINVLYTKKQYSYEVRYYYDDVIEPELTKKISNVDHGTSVTASSHYLLANQIKPGYDLDDSKTDKNTYTITGNNVIINIYYKKNNYGYTVKYHFNNIFDNTFTKNNSALYGSTIYANNHYLTNNELATGNKDGFFLEPNNPSNNSNITIGTGSNELNIYYINTQYNETIEKTTTTTQITNSNTLVDYKVDYNVNVINIKEGTVVTTIITDTLPADIDINNSSLNGGQYNPSTRTITWTNTQTISKYYPSLNINKVINYSVKYINYADISSEENNELTNYVEGKTTIGNIITNGVDDYTTIDVNIDGTLEVLYVDESDNLLESPIFTETKAVGTDYTTNQKYFYGYTFKEVKRYINDEYLDNNTLGKYIEGKTTVKYIYTKNPGTVEDVLVKEGLDKVSSINDTFEYTLNYNAKITDYVGNANLVITDILPYEVKSIEYLDRRCSYNENNNTIICTNNYDITSTNNTISESFDIKVKFLNIDNKVVENNATSKLTYGSHYSEKKAEVETNIEEGNLIVTHKLVDANGKVLEILDGPTTTTKLAGTNYTTSSNSYYWCSLKEILGDQNGEYKANSTIYVDYLYTKNIGNSEEILEKEGPTTVDGVSSKFDYTITYETVITDFKGNAILTIVDILPYQIDLNKSVFNTNICNYSYEDGKATITCSYEKAIDNEHKKISIKEDLSLYYIGITENIVINKVESTLEYGVTKKEDMTQVKTDVKEGGVKVNYVTIENGEYVELTDSITLNGLVDTKYETELKEFDSYTFKKVIGDENGVFTLEEQEVTYIYELVKMPPKTGNYEPITSEINYINYLLMLLVGLILKRRYN